MISPIINMADRMKDTEDIKLESLFATDPLPDDGFSARIEKRIRRRLWMRRLALPVAVVVGGAIAIKPLAGLVTVFSKFLAVLPGNVGNNLSDVSASSLPQLSTIMFGCMLALAFVMISRMLED